MVEFTVACAPTPVGVLTMANAVAPLPGLVELSVSVTLGWLVYPDVVKVVGKAMPTIAPVDAKVAVAAAPLPPPLRVMLGAGAAANTAVAGNVTLAIVPADDGRTAVAAALAPVASENEMLGTAVNRVAAGMILVIVPVAASPAVALAPDPAGVPVSVIETLGGTVYSVPGGGAMVTIAPLESMLTVPAAVVPSVAVKVTLGLV